MRTRVVILAAGKGKRMKSDLPKVLALLNGKPLIAYVAEAVKQSGVDQHPVIVVGYKAELVKNELGKDFDYVEQAEQLGTGHAVQQAEALVKNDAENVMVLYGDQPLIKSETIQKLAVRHQEERATLTLLTVALEDFTGWKSFFKDFGRIIRDDQGNLIRIVEAKDASPEELAVREVNTAFFCFNAEWLWENLRSLKAENVQQEFYLTDLVQRAIEQQKKVIALPIFAHEAVGINTPDHLDFAATL